MVVHGFKTLYNTIKATSLWWSLSDLNGDLWDNLGDNNGGFWLVLDKGIDQSKIVSRGYCAARSTVSTSCGKI